MGFLKVISWNEAKKYATMKEYIVVDLRSEEDYNKGHLDNAITKPNATIEEIDGFNRKDLIWILYCSRGSASFILGREMYRKGYRVMAIAGGYKKV